MSTSVNWNGTTYSIPAAGEVNWPPLSNFLIALGNNASNNITEKQAIRVATSSPVTVSATTDCTVISDLSVAGAVAVSLPAGVDGQMFFILDGKQDAGTNNITITPNGAETIDGGATLVLNHDGQGVWIQYKASLSNWYVLANIVVPGTITPADIVGVIPANKGGTGVANNAASTITVSGNYATTLTVSGVTGVTLPTTGTLATLAGSETLSNKTISSPTVTGDLLLQNPSGSQPTLQFSEDPDSGTNKVTVKAAATMASDYTLTLPSAVAGGNDYALLSTTGGVLSWGAITTNPMTTRGDLIRATTGGTPERLAAVTDNRVVAGDGTDVVSKQIDDPNFFSSGARATSSLGGIVDPYNDSSGVLYAGTYTPTKSGESNVSITTKLTSYMRVGNTVYVSGSCDADVTSASTATEFFITLPIASNLAVITDLTGIAMHSQAGAPYAGGQVIADVSGDKAQIAWYSGADVASRVLYFQFTYIIK